MIRPTDPVDPNGNDPVDAAPGTVGPPSATPGDPHGVTIQEGESGTPPPRVLPSAWSGWPADWWPPPWNSQISQLTDTAWACLDLNSSVLATMPPYLVGATTASETSTWLTNPDPDAYTAWEEFAKQLFWDYQLGEAFVLATAYYATGYPARFHCVPPYLVDVELTDTGTRRYRIGRVDVTADMLHLRYQGNVADARGHGPLEAGRARLIADQVLSRYVGQFAASGGIPASVLHWPPDAGELTAEQAADLKGQWIAARSSSIGEPAVLSGGTTLETVQFSPREAALVELSQLTESRIAVLLGVPPFLVGLPSGGDSMTYSNVTALFDYHWRAGLRPKAQAVMAALSGWLLPRGTSVELNRDAYVQPEPESRARTAQILNAIRDPQGNPALTVEEIRAAERFTATTSLAPAGVYPQDVMPGG
jgi:HK97 family phage portal protein